MKLIFVRHGQATAYCDFDAGRNLTEFGQKQANETAKQLLAHYAPDMIVASPFNRAEQTAKAIYALAYQQGQTPQWLTLSNITPDDDPKAALDDIANLVGDGDDDLCVVVVCHMPIVSRMVEILNGQNQAPFALAQYKVLQLSVIADNLASVIDDFVPKQP